MIDSQRRAGVNDSNQKLGYHIIQTLVIPHRHLQIVTHPHPQLRLCAAALQPYFFSLSPGRCIQET